jgi:hypothetical protein
MDLGRGWKEWKLSIPVFLRFFWLLIFISDQLWDGPTILEIAVASISQSYAETPRSIAGERLRDSARGHDKWDGELRCFPSHFSGHAFLRWYALV